MQGGEVYERKIKDSREEIFYKRHNHIFQFINSGIINTSPIYYICDGVIRDRPLGNEQFQIQYTYKMLGTPEETVMTTLIPEDHWTETALLPNGDRCLSLAAPVVTFISSFINHHRTTFAGYSPTRDTGIMMGNHIRVPIKTAIEIKELNNNSGLEMYQRLKEEYGFEVIKFDCIYNNNNRNCQISKDAYIKEKMERDKFTLEQATEYYSNYC